MNKNWREEFDQRALTDALDKMSGPIDFSGADFDNGDDDEDGR